MKPKKCRNKSCGKEFIPTHSSLEAFCSFPCAKEGRKPDLKLKAVYSKPKLKTCKICKEKFEPKNVSTEVVCSEYNCRVEFALQVVAKNKANKEKEQKRKNTEEKKRMNIDIMSTDKYRSKILQPVINEIARLVDFGQACIATEKYEGKMAGGHFVAVGANRTICLNLHNIFIQSFHSNSWKGGDNLKYREGIKRVFGIEYLNFMENLQSHPKLGLTKGQMIEIHENACKIRSKLRKNEKIRSPKERIELRNQINIELGIYQEEYCIFNQ